MSFSQAKTVRCLMTSLDVSRGVRYWNVERPLYCPWGTCWVVAGQYSTLGDRQLHRHLWCRQPQRPMATTELSTSLRNTRLSITKPVSRLAKQCGPGSHQGVRCCLTSLWTDLGEHLPSFDSGVFVLVYLQRLSTLVATKSVPSALRNYHTVRQRKEFPHRPDMLMLDLHRSKARSSSQDIIIRR